MKNTSAKHDRAGAGTTRPAFATVCVYPVPTVAEGRLNTPNAAGSPLGSTPDQHDGNSTILEGSQAMKNIFTKLIWAGIGITLLALASTALHPHIDHAPAPLHTPLEYAYTAIMALALLTWGLMGFFTLLILTSWVIFQDSITNQAIAPPTCGRTSNHETDTSEPTHTHHPQTGPPQMTWSKTITLAILRLCTINSQQPPRGVGGE